MKFNLRSIGALLLIVTLAFSGATAMAARKSAADGLKQYVDELKTNPGNKALREKIIRMVLGMRSAPALPEEAERNMARGTAFAQRATDASGYRRAIAEFEAAANEAPWLALAYYNLGVVQEKAGLFNEAIQSLRFYLLAAPNARNAREVKNQIYALEADAEAVQAGMNEPAEAPESSPGSGKQLAVAGKPALEIEPDRELRIIKMPQDKKAKMPNFEGNWYFKEHIRGEDVLINAFNITKSANGDLTLIPPRRIADSVATVNVFEIKDKTLKLQMKWKMRSVVGYWKTETYVLTMGLDGKLTGTHNQKSVGGRNIDLDRVLFRQ